MDRFRNCQTAMPGSPAVRTDSKIGFDKTHQRIVPKLYLHDVYVQPSSNEGVRQLLTCQPQK